MNRTQFKNLAALFMTKVNIEISPILLIKKERESYLLNTLQMEWKVYYGESKYIMEDQVTIDQNRNFIDFIKEIGIECFDEKISFNNAGTIFWIVLEETV